MLGLIVTFGDRSPIRCALPGEGVFGAMAHVVQRRGEPDETRAAQLDVGYCAAGGSAVFGNWLRVCVRPGDEIRVRVQRLEHADPGRPSDGVPWPEPGPAVPHGFEAFLNGERLGQMTVAERSVVVADVHVQVRAPGHPEGDEEAWVALSGAAYRPLAVGDEVLFRAI